MPDEYLAHHAPDESPDYPYQARWYTGTRYHADGYERGGWWATEQEAIEGAKRGIMVTSIPLEIGGYFYKFFTFGTCTITLV